MTTQDFNEKYKEYLEKGHYGLAIDIPEAIEYLNKIFEELITIPGFKYHQIKEKFGSSRFYCEIKDKPWLERRLSNEIEKQLDIFLKNSK